MCYSLPVRKVTDISWGSHRGVAEDSIRMGCDSVAGLGISNILKDYIAFIFKGQGVKKK